MNFEIAPKSTEIKANWYDAKLYCFSLGEGWRLPTEEELLEIYKLDNDFEKGFYWSSKENLTNYYSASAMSFTKGISHYYFKTNDTDYVRAVRNIKDN